MATKFPVKYNSVILGRAGTRQEAEKIVISKLPHEIAEHFDGASLIHNNPRYNPHPIYWEIFGDRVFYDAIFSAVYLTA